ncbi:sensor histidine kinase [Glycomyces buryatensis]|uniref:histidine kinase n=1 Tax=Glycomyces buryatensis TaxID=2570927 RepID=A0A4S8Q6L4_9ACTN|nr:sensor histidine kinase [Glycomyces buryatensis]THV39770.1 sensor histidine kinase [Glycomyces buryatensis]
MDTATTPAGRGRIGPLTVVGALWSPATWRALTHLVTGGAIGLVAFGALFTLFIAGIAGAPSIIVPLVAGSVILTLNNALTVLQRSRHRAYLHLDLPEGGLPLRFSINPRKLLEQFGDRKTWSRLAYHSIGSVAGPIAATIAVTAWVVGLSLLAAPLFPIDGPTEWNPFAFSAIGIVVLLAAPWTTRGLAAIDGLMATRMLGTSRSDELERRITHLAASRDSTVDAADAERRRIERDLHDGAQQRITALAINLGIARSTLTDLPEEGRRALAGAHEEALQAMEELRDLVRGLHPAVLEDRGLDAALSAVAARSPVPVRVKVDVPGSRPPRDVETVAYFMVSEALTNVARHSGATKATVDVSQRGSVLHLVIADDGNGGADPGGGTGLRGLADRVRSVDGTFHLHSPEGGPTTIEAELPCAS